ncbi:NAD-dependent epimerase/dehydratase family protein [Anaeromusa acidaminophila]|uniref:NAD-dependent epimerase/dehydratase family protein n=1 Tax=Anaeromusa acidaminophila TaxID=81464 RepID=UPI00036C49AB|nr:NAD-dependent epimerase/dehydratase family protein [Anaeromusa acidaminophila]
MKHVLVTGGAGFIGSHLTPQLLAAGWKVTVLDDLSSGNREYVPQEAAFIEQDVRDADSLVQVFATNQFDAVVHFAAQTMVPVSLAKPVYDCELNVVATVELLEQCRIHGVRKVVFASSAAVYGDNQTLPLRETEPTAPMSFYGLSKHTVERYLNLYQQLHGLEYAALRFANVYGERQGDGGEGGVVSIFTRLLRQGSSLQLFGDGNQTRDFVYAGDVAAAVVASLDSQVPYGTYNVSTGKQTSLLNLIETLSRISGEKPQVVRAQPRAGDILHSALDSNRLQQCSDWRPRMLLEEGLRRTYGALTE